MAQTSNATIAGIPGVIFIISTEREFGVAG
jgi:hypothetical protein